MPRPSGPVANLVRSQCTSQRNNPHNEPQPRARRRMASWLGRGARPWRGMEKRHSAPQGRSLSPIADQSGAPRLLNSLPVTPPLESRPVLVAGARSAVEAPCRRSGVDALAAHLAEAGCSTVLVPVAVDNFAAQLLVAGACTGRTALSLPTRGRTNAPSARWP